MGFYNLVNIEHSPNVYSAQLVMFLETNSYSSRNILILKLEIATIILLLFLFKYYKNK